jgi:hypothetical protein
VEEFEDLQSSSSVNSKRISENKQVYQLSRKVLQLSFELLLKVGSERELCHRLLHTGTRFLVLQTPGAHETDAHSKSLRARPGGTPLSSAIVGRYLEGSMPCILFCQQWCRNTRVRASEYGGSGYLFEPKEAERSWQKSANFCQMAGTRQISNTVADLATNFCICRIVSTAELRIGKSG